MSTPTNTTAATAIVITSLPYNFTNDLAGLTPPFTLWWKYTAVAGDVMLGLVAYQQSGLDFFPEITFWSGPSAASLTQIDSTNYTVDYDTPCQFPVQVGVDYWIKIEDNSGSLVTGVLVFDVEPTPTSTTIVAGSLFINDDTESLDIAGAFGGIYACILSQTNGDVIAMARTTVGEEGAILSTGQIMLQNDDAVSESAKLYIYDAAFNEVTTIALSSSEVCLNSLTTTFYRTERSGSDAILKTYDLNGTLGITKTITGFRPQAIAVKQDGTILYCSGTAAATDIKKFTISTSVLTVLSAGLATHFILRQGLCVLSDDTIVAGWTNTSDIVIKLYNAAGSVIATYSDTPPGTMTDGPRVTPALDDPNSFWIWSSGIVSGVRKSKFTKMKASDGSVLLTFTVDVFESGQGPQGNGNDAPSTNFGNSKSCPFLVIPEDINPVEPNESGIYVTTGTETIAARTNDLLFVDDDTTLATKIPDPTVIIYPAGD